MAYFQHDTAIPPPNTKPSQQYIDDVMYNVKKAIKLKDKYTTGNLRKKLFLNKEFDITTQLCFIFYDAICNKHIVINSSDEAKDYQEKLIKSERENNKLEKQNLKLQEDIKKAKEDLEEYKKTRHYNHQHIETIKKLKEELNRKDYIISGLNRDIDKLKNNNKPLIEKQSITTLKPNINITIEDEEDNTIDKPKVENNFIDDSPSMFDFENDSDISDMEDYNPYSEDNIDPATAPKLQDFTASEIDYVRDMCGYEAWNQLTDQGKLQFLLENEN